MELNHIYESHSYDDVYGLDVVHSVACLQSTVESIFKTGEARQSDLERIRDLAEDVVDIAARLQSHFAPFSREFKLTTSLKDKINDLVIYPIEGLIHPAETQDSSTHLWQSINDAFQGKRSLCNEVNHLQKYLT
ncbi:MAG: hypothetical protein P0S95_01050 [Rhabdochlamydiaceae bacterium]|nr:hypothetical protein [Candidatus Amphrikana amoebophyrae]